MSYFPLQLSTDFRNCMGLGTPPEKSALPVVSLLESNLTWKVTKVLKFHFFWNRKFELNLSAKFNVYNTPILVSK